MVAIKHTPLPLHLEIQRHRGNPVGLIRSSYREKGKVKHSTHGRITGLTLEQLKLLQAAFRGDVVPKGSAEDFQILASKEYGASYAVLELAKELGLDRALYSRKEAWVQDCLAMIVGRIVYAGSKLALSNQWKNTACGNCRAWKAKSMWTSIVISQWIGSWSARARSSVLWQLVISRMVTWCSTILPAATLKAPTPRATSSPSAIIAMASGVTNRS